MLVLVQHAVNAIAQVKRLLVRADVNVARPELHRVVEDLIDRRHDGLALEIDLLIAVPTDAERRGAVFGDQDTIRKTHPYSTLLCPQSPLIITEEYTDAYLELKGWNIPVGVMPMALMGVPGWMFVFHDELNTVCLSVHVS